MSLKSEIAKAKSEEFGQSLDTQCIQCGLPVGIPEMLFHPSRKWRFDRAWPHEKCAVEFHGGVWTGGRHTTGKGFTEDRSKMNEAALMGWIVIEVVPETLKSGKAIEWVERALKMRAQR